MRISLFMPCFNDALFPGTGIATVRILEKLGHDVDFPVDQSCCGQIHFNTGYRKEALGLLRRFLGIFRDSEVVVAPSASCVAMVREQYPELARGAQDSALGEAVRDLAARTFELTEFLVGELGVQELGALFPYRVVFHPTCHSIRGIHVGDAPLRLLEAVEGLELLELEDAEGCCGFGGTFSVKNPHTSEAMLEDKVRDILESGAEVLAALDNSCLLHIAGGLHRMGLLEEGRVAESRQGSGVASGPGPGGQNGFAAGNSAEPRGLRVMHLAEILASGWE